MEAIIFGIVMIIVGIYVALWVTTEYLPNTPRKRILAIIKRVIPEPLFTKNTCKGVTAICLKEDFDRYLTFYMESASKSKRLRDGIVRVSVPSTPTFYNGLRFQRPVHVGSLDQFHQYLLSELSIISGKGEDWWMKNPKTLDHAIKIACDHDPRLFVPFCDDAVNYDEFMVYSKKKFGEFLRSAIIGPVTKK
ncbi:MAG: hypothetical protein ACYCZW_02630 [Minisyncoccota bacterium]